MDAKPLSGRRRVPLLVRIRRAIPRPVKAARAWFIRDRIANAYAQVAELDAARNGYERNRAQVLSRLARLRADLFELEVGVSVMRPYACGGLVPSMRVHEGTVRPILGSFDPALPVRVVIDGHDIELDAPVVLGDEKVVPLSPWNRGRA